MAKRPVRRPTEEIALARIMREERLRTDRELFERAQQLFGDYQRKQRRRE